jgi:NADH-quinone oxidoreductase subunit J
MTILGVIFYLLSAFVVAATVLAITRRNPVHAVVYLALSFLGTAMLLYLLGAPFLAALEVIIYAGAIMVLFLFVIMMLRAEPDAGPRSFVRRWGPSLLLGLLFLSLTGTLVAVDPESPMRLPAAVVTPADFGRFLFERYWLPVEMISLLLFIALIAAVQIGKGKPEVRGQRSEVRGQRSEESEQ